MILKVVWDFWFFDWHFLHKKKKKKNIDILTDFLWYFLDLLDFFWIIFLDFLVFLDFWTLFGFFGFFSKLLVLLLNVREVTTEHGKWPKISTNSVKSSFFAWRKKVLAEGRSPSQELEVSPSSGLYLVLLLNKLYFEGLRHPKLHRVGLWYWWFVYHNVGSNIFIYNFFCLFFSRQS